MDAPDDLNLRILRMFEGTFLLDATHVIRFSDKMPCANIAYLNQATPEGLLFLSFLQVFYEK